MALWKKARKIGITTKNYLDKTKIIIFACKLYAFIPKNNKKKYIEDLYKYCSSIGNIYNKFIKYFKKNWESSFFLDFDILPNGDVFNWTNNVIESFHHKLNNAIEFNHPRISVLVEKLTNFSVEYYHKYVSKLFDEEEDRKNSANVFNDIYNFLKKFLLKYNKIININLLIQDEGETKESFENITKSVLNYLFSFDNSVLEKNKLNDNLEEKDYFQDLSADWWNSQVNKDSNNNKVNQKENDDNYGFNIVKEPVKKKRNYNDLNNFIKTLFD